ncbi:uncharacterized protein DNG_06433 [Cephalotrichum gorgonifer]|uniref:Uncharacterized protein n=1 Tax=Cephalotrichum gorgonifer TaxID=2041049 RepID=A0AAE8SWF7_9PEZI|nr:uncharacterized protein DNG_06433 [Cephalotrichum gorgonifer]
MPAIPSSTLPSPPTGVLARQVTVTITAAATADGSTGLSGGAIAGIVVGSIAAFFFFLWIVWSCMRLGASPSHGGVGESSSPERYSSPGHCHHHHHHRRHSHRPRREVREYRRTSTPVVVDRRRSVSVSSPHRAYTRSRSRGRDTY